MSKYFKREFKVIAKDNTNQQQTNDGKLRDYDLDLDKQIQYWYSIKNKQSDKIYTTEYYL